MRFEHERGSPSRMDLGPWVTLGGEQGADLGGLLVKLKTRHWVHFPDHFNDDMCAEGARSRPS